MGSERDFVVHVTGRTAAPAATAAVITTVIAAAVALILTAAIAAATATAAIGEAAAAERWVAAPGRTRLHLLGIAVAEPEPQRPRPRIVTAPSVGVAGPGRRPGRIAGSPLAAVDPRLCRAVPGALHQRR